MAMASNLAVLQGVHCLPLDRARPRVWQQGLQCKRTESLRVSLRSSAVGRCRKQSLNVRAIAAPMAPVSPPSSPNPSPSPLEDPATRARLAAEYGFRQIGEPLPNDVTLKQVIDSMPAEVFEINDVKAWKSVLISIVSFAASLYLISISPWYMLPFAWALSGTAFTGWFVVGHDCAHKSFSNNKLVEDIVGTLAFMPLIYPYEPWRIKHDRHHAKTNMLVQDTAWHPVIAEDYDKSGVGLQVGLQMGMGPLRFLASIGHWLMYHFDLRRYRVSDHPRVKTSLAAVYGFMAVGWPLIIYFTGLDGWFKFWLMPWLGYHFWMSTFTMVHHTAPHIPFKPAGEWNAAQAQLGGTVHCDYPSWVEVLCHDINVHVPHHVSQKIPSYNLRKATDSLRQNWGKYMSEASWNWRLMKTIFTECHFYDPEENYTSFDSKGRKAPVISTLRTVMPPLGPAQPQE
eukprot:TRINITY_DN11559_c0_g1_i2.p1 TRINITY_DN11559_c0_g1~~TRINITY_DN11559_c0_g1_i2.p1  ORF type:complete len:455 (+),score=71.65 TRINITY_DN11559_c0_g1_i2:360-1724(+)